jgi:hypothetical protein
MSASPGYNVTLKIGGTSTAATGEACSGATTSWQITSTSKRVLDPSVTPTWYDNGTPISSAQVSSVDYLTGRVVFTVSKTGPITVGMSYIPMLTYTGAKAADVAMDAAELDTSVFGSQWKARIQGLKGATGKMTNLELMTADLDPGSNTRKLSDVFTNSTKVILELSPDGGTHFIRFWARLFTTEDASAVDALVVTTADFMSEAVTAADGTVITLSLS